MFYQGSPNEVILSPLANAAVRFNAEDFQLIQLIAYAACRGGEERPSRKHCR
jgi:hypothetical protein